MVFTGDDYRYRFEVDAKQRFIDVLRERSNAGVSYKGRVLKWDTVIEQKTSALARFLTRRSPTDFSEPTPKLDKLDGRDLRARILDLTVDDTKQLGIGKSTLHYLRKRARSGRTMSVYHKVRQRLVPASIEE